MAMAAGDQEALFDRVRKIVPAIAAAADEIEAARALPPQVVGALKNAGLFRIIVPASLGGAELPLTEYARVIEEVAKADASTAWCLTQNAGICRVAAFLPREAAIQVFGTRETALAWGNGPATATEVEGGYRLNGRWSFASGIRHATWLGCQECPVVDEAGQPRLDVRGKQRQCILFFRPADAQIEDVWQVSGLRGTGSDTYSVRDLFVPLEFAACDSPFDRGPLYVFSSTNIFAVGFASVALGIARACLDAFMTLAVTKSPRGIAGVLREQPTVQVLHAQSEATVRSARAFLHETIASAWEEAGRDAKFSLDTRVRLRLATTFTINQSAEVVDRSYHAAGATAIFASEPFERRFRDMHAVTQHLQAREDHYISVGRHLFGLEPDLHWI